MGDQGYPSERWKQSMVSSDGTHHLVEGIPLYRKRYDKVLSFHDPGLAPASRNGRWFHINGDGDQAYGHTFDSAWGFYSGLAAVSNEGRYFHILPNGDRAYEGDFRWCGNFQDNLCTVLDSERMYYHIRKDGKAAYPARYFYAGDYHEGHAVVREKSGMCLHIDLQGKPSHGGRYRDLQPFHKGYAAAYDGVGWFHIDRHGNPLYSDRFSMVEPFYNGRSLVHEKDGTVSTIDESGTRLQVVSDQPMDAFLQVSHDLVGYWKSYVLWAAVKLRICDALPGTSAEVSSAIKIPQSGVEAVLSALRERRYVDRDSMGAWKVTRLGEVLLGRSGNGIESVADHWVEQVLPMWHLAVESLRTGTPAFKLLYGLEWPEWLMQDTHRLEIYTEAMEAYTEIDYNGLHGVIRFEDFSNMAILGHGPGKIMREAIRVNPRIDVVYINYPGIPHHSVEGSMESPLKSIIPESKESDWGTSYDAVLFSKVLHELRDEELMNSLRAAWKSMSPRGELYILEATFDRDSLPGGILSFYTHLLNGVGNRTLEEIGRLLETARFRVSHVGYLRSGVNVIRAFKVGV